MRMNEVWSKVCNFIGVLFVICGLVGVIAIFNVGSSIMRSDGVEMLGIKGEIGTMRTWLCVLTVGVASVSSIGFFALSHVCMECEQLSRSLRMTDRTISRRIDEISAGSKVGSAKQSGSASKNENSYIQRTSEKEFDEFIRLSKEVWKYR